MLQDLTRSAPTEDQIGRAKALAEDLLVVLRIEYQKARDGTAMGGAPGVYQPGSGTYVPAQNGPDYAGYYNVSLAIPFSILQAGYCPRRAVNVHDCSNSCVHP
jgi:hypothetical protein